MRDVHNELIIQYYKSFDQQTNTTRSCRHNKQNEELNYNQSRDKQSVGHMEFSFLLSLPFPQPRKSFAW